jgi:hypothetical protein
LKEQKNYRQKNYRLSPSDLTFLYDKCKYCFVLKVKHGIAQPSIPLPAIFAKIAALQKDFFSGMRTEDFCPDLPPGIVTYGERRVLSSELELPGCTSTCTLAGRFDVVVELDQGSYAVLDFKTGSPTEEKKEMYSRQLQAYAIALENPAPNQLCLSPVSKLGLLFFTPEEYVQSSGLRQNLAGQLHWVDIERDDAAFVGKLAEIVSLLDGPMPEPQPDTCDWCAYRAQTGALEPSGVGRDSVAGRPNGVPVCPKCGGPMRLKSGKFGNFWSCMNFPACKGTRDAR